MDVSQYLEIFIEEAKEHLQSLNTSLLELEKNPNDKELINEVFRVAHTLKGMAATMGFKKMNILTHNMENVLTEIRNDNLKIDSSLLDVLFQCLDALEQYIVQITETGDEGDDDNSNIVNKLNELLNGKHVEESKNEHNIKNDAENVNTEDNNDGINSNISVSFTDFEKHALREANAEGYFSYAIKIQINETCVLKSARAFIVFRTLEKFGQVIKSEPPVQEIEDERFDTNFSVFIVTKFNKETILKELTNISEIANVEIKTIHKDSYNENTKTQVSNSQQKDVNETKKSNSKKNSKPKANKTVRVDIERLDILMNLVSELIIIKNGLETLENNSNRDSSDINEQIEYLERITTNLHDAVMKVRMVPIERVFNRFPRLIRDLSRKLNKNIELHMSGEETELDRTVIDEIGDPLVHLIRNSADHGLETPDERLQSGKDSVGNVWLKAYQDGNNVIIEVEDDGRGINIEKIKSKAIEKGSISIEQLDNMSEKDILELLFKPSFSTADKISDISGRGVGLDVVKTKIEALGGDVEVKTKTGKGSKFIIRLPLTLAIIQALMVNIGKEKYAIPLNTIQIIEDVNVKDIKLIQNEEVINLRGDVIPIIRLDKLLDIERDEEEKENETITVVIVNKGDKKAGLVVDSLIGQQEIVIKTLGKYLTSIKMIAGATILGDGEVALILDVNSLI